MNGLQSISLKNGVKNGLHVRHAAERQSAPATTVWRVLRDGDRAERSRENASSLPLQYCIAICFLMVSPQARTISFQSVSLLKGLKSLLCKLHFAPDHEYVSPIGRCHFMASVILQSASLNRTHALCASTRLVLSLPVKRPRIL